MKATEQKVLRFIKENDLLSLEDKILVALSGGPDSVFLLHFLNKYKKKFKIEIGAVHINHRLRGKDSERDELFCKAICDELSVPFYLLRKDIKSYSKKNKLSLEVAGRKIRYEFFEKISKENKYDKIVTAHNADENAETVLLNLIKGTGTKGIAGIPLKRNNIVRPILTLAKKEILNYLDENHFEYRIDESNLSNEFERNFLRNKVIPLIQKRLNPLFSNSVLTTSLNMQRLISGLEEIVTELKSDIKVNRKKDISIPIELLKTGNEFIVAFVIKDVINNIFSVKLVSNDLKKILALSKKQSGKSEELSQNLIAIRERNEITVQKKSLAINHYKKKLGIGSKLRIANKTFSITIVKKSEVKIGNSKNVEFVSADDLSNIFVLRVWNEGDKFFPIGMQGTKKISDYLNDVKINSFVKKEQLVLENKNRIVWVIGKRLDDRFKITPNTKKVLRLCLQ